MRSSLEEVTKFTENTILVLGDLMVDEYLWGNVDRISPEAPVQVVDIDKNNYTLGGAGNVIENLIDLESEVRIAGVIDDSKNGNLIQKMLEEKDLETDGVFVNSTITSSRKTRILSNSTNQQILRLDRETRKTVSDAYQDKLRNYVRSNINEFDAMVISDYGKGVCAPNLLAEVISLANSNKVPTIIDPKGKDYSKYHGATLIAPNESEVAEASEMVIKDRERLEKAIKDLLHSVDSKYVLVTRGSKGMVWIDSKEEVNYIPSEAQEVFDVTGAGDTVVAGLAAGLAADLDLEDAAEIANTAAGIVVGKIGSETVTPSKLVLYENNSGSSVTNKIKEKEELERIIKHEKESGNKIVFTNGCFDLLHVGHLKSLEESKELGDKLVVAINSDSSVEEIKGDDRPLIGEEQRARILASLEIVDYVTIFDEETPRNLIKRLSPDFLVKGKDYEKKEVVGREIVESYGGEVRLLNLVEEVSTSKIIENIKELDE